MRRIVMLMLLMLLVGCGVAATPTEPVEAPTTASVAPTESSEDPTIVSVAPTEPVEELVAQPTDVLPAPLYLLSNESGSQQIWRIETDGQTTNQISNESADIVDFDVSPTTGELVYMLDQQVIKLSPDGTERTVLFAGPEDNDPYNEPAFPSWSPNGQEIMLAYGGLAVLPASGGEPEVLIPNPEQTDPALVQISPIDSTLSPIAWSPDGQRMLIMQSYIPDGSMYLVVNRDTLEQVELSSAYPYLCCTPVWTIDGEAAIFANSTFGIMPPGLWRANISTGEVINYGPSDYTNGPWLKAAGVFAMPDSSVRGFTKLTAIDEIQNPEAASMDLQMSSVAADGTITALRADSFPVYEALWFPDGSAAVVLDFYIDAEPFIVAPDSDSKRLLPIAGNRLNWGR